MKPVMIAVLTWLAATTISLQASAQVFNGAPGYLAGGHRAATIFVDSFASPDGDGSVSAPYQTITRAVQRAREIRAQRQSRIIVRVAPGWYVEDFPIYLDLSNFALRGSTHLIKDEDGLPQNCGTDVAASPCVAARTVPSTTPKVLSR